MCQISRQYSYGLNKNTLTDCIFISNTEIALNVFPKNHIVHLEVLDQQIPRNCVSELKTALKGKR